jgi:hypothetical protein
VNAASFKRHEPIPAMPAEPGYVASLNTSVDAPPAMVESSAEFQAVQPPPAQTYLLWRTTGVHIYTWKLW